MTKFVTNRQIYEQVVRDRVPLAKRRLWIATADIKDMYVDSGGREMIPFLEVLSDLVGSGVEVRLIHAKEPGPNFREDFDRYPRLATCLERALCPRVHFKCIIIEPHVDGRRSKTLEYDSVDIVKASARMDIPVLIGMKEDGKPLVVDLARLPHLLVSGITGSGKTVFLSAMLYGFLKRFTPEEIRLALYDEKCVEFTPWLGSPYLYRPVVTDAKKVLEVLKDLASEMKRRFEVLSAARCRNVQDYNTSPSFSPAPKREKMPYIVFVADEIAELMANEGKQALPIISRLTSMGRAAGIHLVLATSRPAREVVSAQLKANIPGRIAFKMFNGIDSRQIINVSGAQNLSGRGDLLFTKDGADWIRAQGAWVSDETLYKEIEKSVKN